MHGIQVFSRLVVLFDSLHGICESVTVLEELLVSDHLKELSVSGFLHWLHILGQELWVVCQLENFNQERGHSYFSHCIITFVFLRKSLGMLV